MFSWSTDFIHEVSKKPQLDPTDMPFLPQAWRATYQMKRFLIRPTDRGLIAHLLYVNKGVIGIQIALAAISSTLYYLPAFFELRLVEYLEAERDSIPYSVGLFYCFGLLFSYVFEAIISLVAFSSSSFWLH